MLASTYATIISLAFIIATLITAIKYEENDLAKVCRPLDRQLDLLFILDGSGSVSGNTFATQMAMLNKFNSQYDRNWSKNTQIAVMQYSSYTRVEFNFSANPVGCCFKDFQKLRCQTKESLRASLQKIRHISGTTRTGKALDKALYVFRHDPNFGTRMNQDDVAQVAIVVTDGHSHDDPVPAALRLRQAGIQILTLGIGAHINMGELVEITGPFGAEINCYSDSVEITVSVVNPFYGHLYVSGQFHHPECQNPMGTLFETIVVLKFHPLYNTKVDKVFKVQCFYPEKAPKLSRKDANNQLTIRNNNELQMPCSYKMLSNLKSNDKCKLEDVRVGDQIIHSWECNKDSFDTYQSMLVHSCVIMDLNSGRNKTVIDSIGCALDNSVIDPPEYVEPLSIFAVGKAVKFPDSSMIKMKCHLRFCDRLLGECDAILPPRCRRNRRAADESNNKNIQSVNTFSKEINRSWHFTDSINADDDDDNDDDDEYEDENTEVTNFALPIATTTTTTTTTTAITTTTAATTTTTTTTSITTTTTTTTTTTITAIPTIATSLIKTTTSTTIPLLTFHPSYQEKLIPSRRRLTIKERIAESGSHSIRSLPILLAANTLDTTSQSIGNLINENDETPFAIPLLEMNNKSSKNHPRIIDFPKGGMDVKINTQNVAIISDDRLKEQYQRELNEQQERMKLSAENISKISLTTALPIISRKTITPMIKANKTVRSTRRILQQPNHRMSRIADTKLSLLEVENENENEYLINDSSQEVQKQIIREPVEEIMEEIKPVVQLEQRILKMIRLDSTVVESQVINVRDLEVMIDPNLKEKWCKK
ncbi:hypothetical protein DINM_001444 [Dirofilaria immitis]|nr:hypothetical protein [Dirofilaria immitis]